MSDSAKHLDSAHTFAEEHAETAQAQYTKYHNARAVDKSFNVGEQMIVLGKNCNSKRLLDGKLAQSLRCYLHIAIW
jgi:hypothetical protein